MTTALPPVAPEVAADALDLLPARLRKRVDATVTKAAAWPVEPADDGAGVRVRVAEDTTVTLTTTDGVVATADAAVCSCLLSPACLHRAAVLTMAPLADPTHEPPTHGNAPGAEPESHAPPDGTAGPGIPESQALPDPGPAASEPGATARADKTKAAGAPSDAPSAAQLQALDALQRVGERVLAAGVGGTGAVVRAELVRAAHGARVAGLHRAAAVGLRIAQRVGEARGDDPGFRLDALAGDLAELFALALRPADAVGTARRTYRPAQPLRLTGLFTEPVVTASGYAGVTTYALAPDGTLHTLADVRPGGPDRVAQAAAAPVPGGCALALRELGDGGGVLMTSPNLSHDGRVGGGTGVRSVSVTGTGWSQEPAAALWRRSPAEQFAAADGEGPGEGLLFLDGTLTPYGLAVTGGPTVALYAPDERPELPYAENLRLLAAHPGLRIRLIARVVPGRPGGVHALAAQWTDRAGDPFRADLGLRRIHRADLPDPAAGAAGDPTDGPVGAPVTASGPAPALPLELELLRRTVERAVAGGRVVGAAGDADLPRRLRAVGLGTGAECARTLRDTAADHRRDALGRMVPADPAAYARAWLTAAVYVAAATRSCLAAAWAG
ncbi:hypothetical protein ABZO31_10120 [Streptomyces sp. HUAS MG47]|uniref:hypothetical protein n=1 Tax=Streptomyces solicamelliae TaxID=3231716 RepID=UPI003878051C